MKKLYVRIFSVLIISAIFVGLLGACKSETKGAAPSSMPAQSTQASKEEDKGASTKIVNSPLTLTYWSPIDQKISNTTKNLNELACYKELEKRTGIHIDFQHPPVGQENEQFNLMLASNDLPDLIWWSWPTIVGGPAKAINDKFILKLNDAIGKDAPNLKKVFEKYGDAKLQSMLDDGTLYMMPFIKPDKTVRTMFGPQLRKDWLDKLGLKVPQSIDEWYTVLKAFKENDPNGNGQKDEIPFISTKLTGINYWAAAFGVNFQNTGFYNDKNVVKYGPVEPAYKDFLTTMNQWYKEGLIDSDFAITDQKQFDAKVTGNKAGAYFGLASGNLGRYMNTVAGKDPNFKIVATPWPKGKAGAGYNTRPDAVKAIPGQGIAITTQNKHVAESIKWCDYQYSDEGSLLMNFGIEGESYKMVNGYPTYTDIIFKNPNGLTPDQAIGRYATTFGSSMVYDSRYYEQILTLPEQKDAIKTWAQGDMSLIMPLITPTSDESSRVASIMSEVNTYTDEMFTKFVMGQEPLTNFDKYVQAVKGMKIDEAVKLEQAALDRYNKRK